MSYIPMFEVLPEYNQPEFRSFTVLPVNNLGVPTGNYDIVEMFCNDEDCDCRRVILCIVDEKTEEAMAYIAYGWGSKDYYASWATFGTTKKYSECGKHIKQSVEVMYGIHLNGMSSQSKYAPQFLSYIKEMLSEDKEYTNRIKKHYKLFRAEIDRQYSIEH